MAELRKYKVFISHAWHRDEEYWRVYHMLNTASRFAWENLSVPEHDQIDAEDIESLKYELRNQMRPANVFIICAGMWVPHSDWISFEIQFARRIGRPIIAVPPWGAQRTPAVLNGPDILWASRQDTLVQTIRYHAVP